MHQFALAGAVGLAVSATSGVTAGFIPEADIANEISSEYARCAAYYQLILTCFSSELARRPEFEHIYKSNESFALRKMYSEGKKANQSDETLFSRSEQMMLEAIREIQNDCQNVSDLIVKHGKECKALMDDPDQRMDALRSGR